MAAKTIQIQARTEQTVIPTATDRAVRLPEVIQLSGRSKTSIYADIKAGTFPAGFAIGSRARAWSLNSINNWLVERMQGGVE